MNIQDYDWDRVINLGFSEESAEGLKDACWKGYTALGMKTKNGKKVPNCVPDKKRKGVSDFHDAFHSMEPNGAMAVNQLRVMQEKIAILLNLVHPEDNLEPWMATKLTMSSQNLASVADYLRFGVEFSEEA
jgi:hypothetical protein